MNIKNAIERIKNNPKRYKVILVNQNSKKYLEECEELNLKTVNINKKLSEILSNLSSIEMKNESWDKLKEYLENLNDEIIVIKNTDFLFSPEVGNINPVHNFNYYSRDKQIIILFLNARKVQNTLRYSEEGNPDYTIMDLSENEFILGWEDEN